VVGCNLVLFLDNVLLNSVNHKTFLLQLLVNVFLRYIRAQFKFERFKLHAVNQPSIFLIPQTLGSKTVQQSQEHCCSGCTLAHIIRIMIV